MFLLTLIFLGSSFIVIFLVDVTQTRSGQDISTRKRAREVERSDSMESTKVEKPSEVPTISRAGTGVSRVERKPIYRSHKHIGSDENRGTYGRRLGQSAEEPFDAIINTLLEEFPGLPPEPPVLQAYFLDDFERT